MELFGQIVRTVVNTTVVLPVALVRDVLTLGGAMTDDEPATPRALELIKRDASPRDDHDARP